MSDTRNGYGLNGQNDGSGANNSNGSNSANGTNNTSGTTDTNGGNDRGNTPESTRLEEIEKTGSVAAKNARESIYCLSVIGQIEGHFPLGDTQKATKYEHLIPLLVALEEDDATEGVLIVLNTMGGDVEAGLALSEMIASMTKPTVSLVLGGGHSIGVPLATAARRSFIVPSATMTLHPVRINGLVVGVPQTFRYFGEMQKRIVGFICDHSHADRRVIEELMMRPDELATDVGSILEGKQAVEYGIIDEVGGLDRALDALRRMIHEKRGK